MKLHPTFHSLCAVFSTSLVLSACGGGSSPTPTATGTSTSFKIVNNYVSGATVFRDENGDGVANGSEVSGTTDVNGDVTLTYTAGSTPVAIQSNGGSYTLDGETIEVGVLLSRDDYDVVTPLTTLFIASDPANVSASGAALESAQNEFMAATLGVDVANIPAGLSLNIDTVTPPAGLSADTTSALSTFRVAGATIGTALRAAALDGGTGIPTKDAVLAASRGVVAFVQAGNSLTAIASNPREMVVYAVAGAKNPTVTSVSGITPALVETARVSAATLIGNIQANAEAVKDATQSVVTPPVVTPPVVTPPVVTPPVVTPPVVSTCSISVVALDYFNIRMGTTADLASNSEVLSVGSGVTVNLASSATGVATVSGTTITPVAQGDTIITATGSGSSCTSKSVTFTLGVIGASASGTTGSGTGVVLSGTGSGSSD